MECLSVSKGDCKDLFGRTDGTRQCTRRVVSLVLVVTSSCQVMCLGQPRLDGWARAWEDPFYICSVRVGDDLGIWVDLTNTGTEDLYDRGEIGSAVMQVHITPTGLFSDDVAMLCRQHYYGTIHVGETVTMFCSGTVPDLTPGTYEFVVEHDYPADIWNYPGVTLDVLEPGAVACCFSDGRPCENLPPSQCEARGGIPNAWSTCCDYPCPVSACACLGDLSRDGTIMTRDIGWLISLLGRAGPPYRITRGEPLWDPCADMDGDGVIVIKDLGELIGILGASGPPYRQACQQ